jgi:hypothetical protein
MQVIIDEVVSRVRAVDGRSALAPETMRAIIEKVLECVREEMAHDERVRRERATNNGYADTLRTGGQGQ